LESTPYYVPSIDLDQTNNLSHEKLNEKPTGPKHYAKIGHLTGEYKIEI